jgi:hypothetical protein
VLCQISPQIMLKLAAIAKFAVFWGELWRIDSRRAKADLISWTSEPPVRVLALILFSTLGILAYWLTVFVVELLRRIIVGCAKCRLGSNDIVLGMDEVLLFNGCCAFPALIVSSVYFVYVCLV